MRKTTAYRPSHWTPYMTRKPTMVADVMKAPAMRRAGEELEDRLGGITEGVNQ